MASPNGKVAETMPTQKLFKRRVRARMAKTGESYTTARFQLLRRKATDPELADGDSTSTTSPDPTPGTDNAQTKTAPEPEAEPEVVPREITNVPDESMRRTTGRSHAEWFRLLDAWGAPDHTHTEIARWLGAEHGVAGWWTQSITVSYERARGLRARHQMTAGFEVTVNRTVTAPVAEVLTAFTDEARRSRWLPDVPVRQRPTRAVSSLRFDWPDPASRIVVGIAPRGSDRTTVSVVHDRLPDAASAATQKAA